MEERATPSGNRSRTRILLYLLGVTLLAGLTAWLRRFPYSPDPLLYGLLQITSGVLAFTFAACAMVRFRGTRDRSALVLAFAFSLSGGLATSSSVIFLRQGELAATELGKNPATWGLSGALLAALMLLSLAASRGLPAVRYPGREIAASLFLVAAASYFAGRMYARLPDAAFAASQLLMVTGYAVALGGALIDNARVFDRVHQLASSDALTGLGNYRRLLDVLDSEVQRSGRTGRPFAVVLLDLDGLKHINDRYGHLVGSQALCRLANVLSNNCRAIDTAARYGGDEFALVLPETDERAAQEVATRICDRLAADQRGPRLSVSVGVAIYPQGGAKIEHLLAGADEALYAMKSQRKSKSSEAPPGATTGWLFER